jgi:hypothetical protein
VVQSAEKVMAASAGVNAVVIVLGHPVAVLVDRTMAAHVGLFVVVLIRNFSISQMQLLWCDLLPSRTEFCSDLFVFPDPL